MKIITAKNISPFPVALVVSQFNQEITDLLLQNAKQRLQALNFPEQMTTIVRVPGAVEIPVTAQRLASSKQYDAIICLGAVIRGETSHYDYVCQQVSYGCQKVALTYNIPVIFAVLTTENEEQAQERVDKGREAVDAAAHMVSVFKQLA